MAVPATRAMQILSSRFRSSRMCSISDIRPSGSAPSAARMRALSTRAPLTVSPSFAMAAYERRPGSAGRGVLRAGRRRAADLRCLRRGLLRLEVADLLLEHVDLWLVRLGGDSRGGLLRLGLVLMVQIRDLSLQDAHRLAEGSGRVRQLLGAEKHDQYHGDDEDLPRTVEQVANHFRPLHRERASPR